MELSALDAKLSQLNALRPLKPASSRMRSANSSVNASMTCSTAIWTP
ncbi:MAG: hypothetical protein LW645_00020 [Verrucomicrobiaceae bacterium]|jgi:hypothetical protein|nr:hypothetical protein [Verrucomicrobiaceae bacterium]